MSRIPKRVFGSDLEPDIKEKLENTQAFGSGIFDSQIADSSFQYDDFQDATTFEGTGYFSSKTPFARMWTAISVVKKNGEKKDVAIDETEPLNFDEYRYYFKNSKTDNEEPKIKRQPITRLPETGPKIYTLGTNASDTSDRGVLDAQSPPENLEILTPTQRDNYLQTQFQYDDTKTLRPPAGITRVSSTTQGSLGPVSGVLKTTVEFTVYDFEEYDLIYSKYFLRPGAQIFVDFGWTNVKNFSLYNPEDIVKAENKDAIDNIIYGETDIHGVNQKQGQLQKSGYEVQFVQGKVTNASADLDPITGAYKCKIDISSKNQLLANPSLEEDNITGNAKENLLSNLDYRILKLAADQLYPDGSIIPDDSYSTTDSDTWKRIANSFAAEVLGDSDFNIPNALNTELGIYWKGTFNGKKKTPTTTPDSIYCSWGFIEDNIINKEFATYFKLENQFLDASNGIEYNSSTSYTAFNEELYKRQTFLKSGGRILPFLFPESWDITYNTKKNKSPARGTAVDKKDGVIPIREVFIQLKVIKQAIKEAQNLKEMFIYIFNKLAIATGYSWNWGVDSTTLTNDALGIVDRNFVNKRIIVAGKEGDIIESFYDELFKFEPFSPKTLVKSFSLNLSLGGSDVISSKLALTGLGAGAQNIFPASTIIDQMVAQMALEDSEGEAIVEIEYVPKEGNSKIESFFKEKNSTDPKVSDPAYLSAVNIYGDTEITADVPAYTSKKISAIINKSTEVAVKITENRVKPSFYPSEEFKDYRKETGYRFLKNTYEYFTESYITTSITKRPTILPLKLTLNLHGFSGFAPGDLFRIGMIPSRYYKYVYFQVMQVQQDVSPGSFNTTLQCVMRFQDDKKESIVTPEDTLKTKKVLSPFVLKNEFNCKGIDKVLPFLGYVEPVYENKTNAEYIFKIYTRIGGTTDDIYECLEKTFNLGTEGEKKDADTFYTELKNSTDSICVVKKKDSEDGKKRAVYKIYNFSAETVYYIYIKKQTWFIYSTLKTTNIKPFDLLSPKPSESLA